MAERSRDDELNRTVQAETRQGRKESVCCSHVRAKGEFSIFIFHLYIISTVQHINISLVTSCVETPPKGGGLYADCW